MGAADKQVAEAGAKAAAPSSGTTIISELDRKLLSAAEKKETKESDILALVKAGANINVKDDRNGRTPLHIASRAGDKLAKVVEALLRAHAEINAQDDNDNATPLSIACTHGSEKVAKLLLSKGAKYDTRDVSNQRTPLHLAVRYQHSNVAKALLRESNQRQKQKREGIDINAADKLGKTALHFAAANGLEEVVDTLLKKGARVELVEVPKNRVALHLAVQNGHLNIVRALLGARQRPEATSPGPEVNSKDKFYQTPLHYATYKGNNDIAKTLLEYHATVTDEDIDGNTPLHFAARFGNIALVEALLTCSTSAVNTKNKLQETPLHYAAKNEKSSEAGVELIVKALLMKGADIDAKSETDGETPLHYAARVSEGAVKALLDLRPVADINEKNKSGYTPLQSAIRHKKVKIVEKMLERTLPGQYLSHQSRTTLEFAIRNGNVDIAKLFLSPSQPTSKEIDAIWSGESLITPLSWAVKTGDQDLVRVLLEHNADKDLKLQDGWTALHYASSEGFPEIVQLLLDFKANPAVRTQIAPEVGQGDSPLSLAAAKLNFRVVGLLLDLFRTQEPSEQHSLSDFFGYDNQIGPDKDRYNDETLRAAADHKESQELVEIVLRERRERGTTLLLTVASSSPWNSDLLSLQTQIDHELDFTTRKSSWSALIWAVYCGQLDLVERVLAADNKTHERAETERGSARSMAETICNVLHSYVENKRSSAPASGRWQAAISPSSAMELSGDSSLHQGMHDRDSNCDRSNQTLGGDERRDDKKFLRILEKVEEVYLNICDSVHYHGDVPSNAVVNIGDLNTPISKPTVNEATRKSIDGFYAGIIDIHNKNDGVAFIRRSRRVASVLYDKGAEAIMESVHEPLTEIQATCESLEGLGAKDEAGGHENVATVRWVHLPANNMKWMEDFVLRLLYESKTKDQDLTLSNTCAEFLWQSWHELPKGDSQARFMKPTCLKQEKGRKPRTSGKGKQECMPKPSRTDKKSERKATPASAASSEVLALYMPYLTFGTLTTKEYESDRDPQASQYNLSLDPPKESYQDLFDTYKRGIVHGSRTLDEFFYNSMSDRETEADLNLRNKKQVTSKRISDVNQKGAWKIIRIDQLWLWVIDNKTVLSSSTHRQDKEKDPVLEEIWNYMSSQKVREGKVALPSSAYEMAKFITDFCIDFFDHSTCPVGPMQESMQEIYKNSINKTARDEAQLFDKFKKKINKNILNIEADMATEKGKAKKENDGDAEERAKQQAKENFESIKEASARLKDIKDIRDELNMLKAVLMQQQSVRNELYGITAEAGELSGAAYAINNIIEMDNHAGRVQEAVLSVLELEQNEAAMQEAMSSREQAQESIRQGRTLMVFTIVTILFLPASFLASLFALDIAAFPHEGDSLAWPNWALGVIFGLTIALSAVIIALAFYLDHIKRFIFEYCGCEKPSSEDGEMQTSPRVANRAAGYAVPFAQNTPGPRTSPYGHKRTDSADTESRMSSMSQGSSRNRTGKGQGNPSPILPR